MDLIEDVSTTAPAGAPGKVLDYTEAGLRRTLNFAESAIRREARPSFPFVVENESPIGLGSLAARSTGLRLVLALKIERNCCADQIL